MLDDDGPPPTQPSQNEEIRKNKTVKRKVCELGEGSGKNKVIPDLSNDMEDWLTDLFGEGDEPEKTTDKVNEETMQNTAQFVEEKVKQVKEQVHQGEKEKYKYVDEDDKTS